jgi:hypothetical protein
MRRRTVMDRKVSRRKLLQAGVVPTVALAGAATALIGTEAAGAATGSYLVSSKTVWFLNQQGIPEPQRLVQDDWEISKGTPPPPPTPQRPIRGHTRTVLVPSSLFRAGDTPVALILTVAEGYLTVPVVAAIATLRIAPVGVDPTSPFVRSILRASVDPRQVVSEFSVIQDVRVPVAGTPGFSYELHSTDDRQNLGILIDLWGYEAG